MRAPSSSSAQAVDGHGTIAITQVPVTPITTDAMKVACSNCNLRELCMPLGLNDKELGLIDDREHPVPQWRALHQFVRDSHGLL
jgi:CRP/FNR family transcriptional regulator, anaerobic regulatory protein